MSPGPNPVSPGQDSLVKVFDGDRIIAACQLPLPPRRKEVALLNPETFFEVEGEANETQNANSVGNIPASLRRRSLRATTARQHQEMTPIWTSKRSLPRNTGTVAAVRASLCAGQYQAAFIFCFHYRCEATESG